MMHKDRRWSLSAAATPDELARLLTEHTWTLCSAFCVAGHENYLFVNDATSENGAQEYAVLKGRIGSAEFTQIESITFSWCTAQEALEYVRSAIAGRMDDDCPIRHVRARIESAETHRTCHLCA
jgi:hypothetical protein